MATGLLSITLLWLWIVAWPPLLLLCLWVTGFGTGTWSNFGPMFAELFPTARRTGAGGTARPAAGRRADALGVSRVLITFAHERASAVAVAMAVIDG